MTEDEARAWIATRYGVSRETMIARYVALLSEHAALQNLISPKTVPQIWARHIVDSAQLLDHVPIAGDWLDIGSGAGLPGLIAAILRDQPVELVEPRKLRTAFLENVCNQLELKNVTVQTAKVERTQGVVSIISARAVASPGDVFRIAAHRSSHDTVWLLPKGRNAHSEVEEARRTWQGSFHVERSITAPDSLIVIARKIRPR